MRQPAASPSGRITMPVLPLPVALFHVIQRLPQRVYVAMRCDLSPERKLLCARGLRTLLVPRCELRHFARSFRRSEANTLEMSVAKTKKAAALPHAAAIFLGPTLIFEP